MTFSQIIDQDHLFIENNTKQDYDEQATYWVKLSLERCSGDCPARLINFTANGWDQSWEDIDIWLLQGDSITTVKSGNAVAKDRKPLKSHLNLLRLNTAQDSLIDMYVRIRGVAEIIGPRTDHISFQLINEEFCPGMIEGYPFDGRFHPYATNFVFTGNPITTHDIVVDQGNQLTIDYVKHNWAQLEKRNLFETKHAVNTTYWIKTTLYGSTHFNGKQLLHISSTPLYTGADMFSFDYVETSISDQHGNTTTQLTGDHVSLKDRPYRSWPNFIKINIEPSDTLEVLIKASGADRRFLMSNITLYHIDESSVYPQQVNKALEAGIFFGIIGLQFLFFCLLYTTEKDPIHIYYSILLVGLFSIFCFTEASFKHYVLLPTLRDYHVPLIFFGNFLLQFGAIKFTQIYFQYPSHGKLGKHILNTIIVISFLLHLYVIIKFEYDPIIGNPTASTYMLVFYSFVPIPLITALIISIKAPYNISFSKKYYWYAFFPVILFGAIHIFSIMITNYVRSELLITLYKNSFWFSQVSVISMITFFALSIGRRMNRLKIEKNTALQLAQKNQIIADKNKENELLLKEVNHRTKNNLQVLSSLISLQSDHTTDHESILMLKEGRNRIEAMSLIHQQLYRNKDVTTVELRQYIEGLCRYLEDAFYTDKKSILIQEEVNYGIMDVDFAVPLGLIINELVTNTVKYAKFDTPEGLILIDLNERNDELMLRVKDEGVSTESTTSSATNGSFGTKLIEILSKKLKGEISVDTSSGYSTTIKFSRYKYNQL